MRKALYQKIIFIFFITTLSLFASQNADLDLTDEQAKWLKSQKEIKIGIQENWIPLSFTQNGVPKGLAADYIHLLNAKLGGKLKIVADTFNNNLEKLKNGSLDAMMDITPTKEREKYYFFTTPYADIPHYIITLKNNKEYFNTIEDLSGKSVAVEKGYGIIKKLKKNVPGIRFIYYDNTVEAVEALSGGKADAYVGNRAVVNYILQNNFITNLDFHGKSTISRSLLAIGVNRSNEILRDILQKAYDTITIHQKQDIFENYVGHLTGLDNKIKFTPEESRWLLEHKKVRVGGEKDWPPFDFVGANGQYQGISKDIMDLISQKSGLEFEYITGQSWKELLEDLKKGKLDILPAIYKNKAREEFTLFTKPYFTVKDYIFSRADDDSINTLNDLENKKVAVIEGYAIEENLRSRFPRINLCKVKNKAEGIDAVLLNKADLYIDGYAVVMHTIKSDFITGLKPVIPMDYYTNDLHIGISKSNPLLASIVSKALNSITLVEKNNILNKWLLSEILKKGSNSYTLKEKAWIEKNPSIRLAYMNYWPVDDQQQNIHKEYIKLLSQYGKININLVKFNNWKEGFDAAAKGEKVQGILNLSWSKERQDKSFDYTRPYYFTPAYILVRKGNNSINSLEDLSGKSIYLKENSITGQILEQLNYDIDPVLMKSDLDMYKTLSQNKDPKVQAILTYTMDPELMEQYDLKVVNKFFSKYGEVHIGISKKQKELFSIINKAYGMIPKEKLSMIQNRDYKKSKVIKLNDSERKWIKKNPVIKIAVVNNYPPYDMRDENGTLIGFHSDIAELINKKLGINILPVPYNSWNDAYNAAVEGKVNSIFSLSWTKERENKHFIYSSPYHFSPYYLVVKKENNDILSLEYLKGKKIAVETNTIFEQVVKEKIPSAEILFENTTYGTFKSVAQGKADATLSTNIDSEVLKKEGLKIASKIYHKSSELYIGTNKKFPLAASILRKGLDSISLKEMAKIREKWFDINKADLKISLTKEEKEWLKNHKTVKFTADPNYMPYESFNKNAQYQGMVADYLKIIEESLDIKFEKIVTKSWSESLQKALSGEVDVLSNYTVDDLLKDKHISTVPYIVSPVSIVSRKGSGFSTLQELKGKKVAVVKGYGYLNRIFKNYPYLHYIEVENAKEGLKGVSSSEFDAMVCSLTLATYNIAEMGLSNLEVSGQTDVSMKLGLGIRKDWKIFVHAVNKVIDSIPKGVKQEINRKWLGMEGASFKKIEFTPKEQAWIDKGESISYVYDPDWAPFEWKNELGGHTGIIYDILNLISQRSGINFKQIPSESWDKAVESVKSRKAQMYSAVGENEDKREYMNFTSRNIYQTPYVFVVRQKDKRDYFDTFKNLSKESKIAVVKDYYIDGLLKEKEPHLDLVRVGSIHEGFEKLEDKTIDIFVINASTAKYFINRKGYDNLKIATKTKYNLELKIALLKSYPKEVISILDKAIESIGDKELSDIYLKWTELMVEEKIDWELIYKITALSLLILLGIFYWNRKLKAIVDEKTAELKALLKSFDTYVIASKTDEYGRITYVSDALCDISGYSKKQLMGKTHNILRHEDMGKELYTDLWRTVKNGKVWRGEIKNKRKDGSFFWTDTVISPEFDHNQNITGFSAIRQDITAKKEVEQLSRTLEAKVEDRTSELNDERQYINSIMNSQTNIVISSDGNFIKTANRAFFNFFDIKDVESFVNKYGNCICDTFDMQEPLKYLQKDMCDESWLDYVYERPNELHKAKIVRNGNDHVFTVTADKFFFKGKELKTAVFTDITELEKIREEIERILSNILLPILITSKKRRKILYANKHAQIQYEKALEEIIGSDIDDIYTIKGQHFHILDAIKKDGKIENSEEQFRTWTGKEFTALLSVTPIRYKGEEAFIGMVTDITKQKEIEKEIRRIHKHTKSSIEYASLIQHAIIPNSDNFTKYFKDYFTLWEPKDIVGGDIYLFDELRTDNECLLMVIDCTGHGVPGAFVTMLVKALERQISAVISTDLSLDVSTARILEYFNKTMKHMLKQEDENSISNAGFDAALLYYNKEKNMVKFSGAELPLFYLQNGEYMMIRGDRHSIGYKKSKADFEFKEHIIDISTETSFYLTTDGFIDQNGGEKGFPFGKKRFKSLIEENYEKAFEKQKTIFSESLKEYQKDEERNDDVTVVGIKIDKI